jgi:hypothetical protein
LSSFSPLCPQAYIIFPHPEELPEDEDFKKVWIKLFHPVSRLPLLPPSCMNH